jgi:hypothetical protein
MRSLILTISERNKLTDAVVRLDKLMHDPQEGTSVWRDVTGQVLDEVAAFAPSYQKKDKISFGVTTSDKIIALRFLDLLVGGRDVHSAWKIAELASIIAEMRRVCSVHDESDDG